MCYNIKCLDEQKRGVLFLNAVTNHNIFIVGKAPLVSGPIASRCSSRQRRQTSKGRFVMLTDNFGYWLAGLTDGEGCFHARTHIRKRDNAKCLVVYFAIKMRADDRPMLERIMTTLGIGNIYTHEEKLSKFPQCDYRVNHRDDLSRVIIPFFDRYPLQSKKKNDYDIWRKIVLEYKCAPRQRCGIGIGSLPDDKWDEVVVLTEWLREQRTFEIDPATATLARRRVEMTQPPLFVMQPEQLSFQEN